MEPKSLVESMRWVPPVESPQAKYEREARRLASEALYERFIGGSANGGTVSIPRTPTADELEALDAEKAARTAALEADRQAEAAALMKLGQLQNEFAKLGPKLDAIEREARNERGAEQQRRLSEACTRITEARRAAGKRELSPAELRSKAAEAIRRSGR